MHEENKYSYSNSNLKYEDLDKRAHFTNFPNKTAILKTVLINKHFFILVYFNVKYWTLS